MSCLSRCAMSVQNSAREARGEKFVRSRPLPLQTGGKNEGLKMISVFL